MNSNLLKGVMTLNGDNITMLADYLQISRQTLSLKIDGISDFKLSEIVAICEKYHLTDVQILAIFFNEVHWDEDKRSSKNNGSDGAISTDRFTNATTTFWGCC